MAAVAGGAVGFWAGNLQGPAMANCYPLNDR